MATVTITLTDLDLDLGSYKADIKVDESTLDDGFATAAHIAGHYIYNAIHTEDFRNRVWDFAREFIANNEGASIANDNVLSNQQGDASAAN